MIGHVGFYVDDLEQNNAFYRPLLKVIGYEVIFTTAQCIAFGMNQIPSLEIYIGKQKSLGVHIAFNVADKNMVKEFYDTALKLGATDNGAPGYRDYFPNYYAAFVIDPNGNNLEALFWERPL